VLATVLAALTAVAIGVAVHAADALEQTELRSLDLRFEILGPPTVDTSGIAVVSLDGVSDEVLDERYGDSGRHLIDARLIDRLRRAKTRVIAYDFELTERGGRPRDDKAMRAAIRRAPKILLAASTGNHRVLGGPDAVAALGARVGHSGFPKDADGAVRRMIYRLEGLPTFAVAVAEAARGQPLDPEQLADGAPIAFQGGAATVTTHSLVQVLDGRVPGSALRDKVVVVGPGDPALGDFHRTPLDPALPGPELHANAIATALGGFPLSRAPAALDYALVVLLGLAAPLASLRLSAVRMLAFAGLVLVAFLMLAGVAFRAGTVVAVVTPALALLLGAAGAFAVTYMLEIRERRRLRGIFERFVPEDVAERAVSSTAADLRSGGERIEATVMFADLRGFTRFAEGQTPAVVSDALNRYLGGMSEAIREENGTVVSYMGDGIMAVFGAPIEQPDHAARAVSAAREMTGPRLRSFNEWLGSQGLGAPFLMGVGLSTGEVLSGNVGSMDRVEYTALGDTTNVAARLEAMTKKSGHSILMTEATVDQLPGPDGFSVVQVGELKLPGRNAPCAVWTLDGAG
jgi:adenylate cyclase